MNNEEKIQKIIDSRIQLKNEIIEKCDKITAVEYRTFRQGPAVHKTWTDNDGDILEISMSGIKYGYVSQIEKEFTIPELKDMIRVCDKLLIKIDENINKEYEQSLEL